MNEKIINLIFLASTIFPVVRMLYKLVIQVFTNYMFNQETKWNRHIDKPRLFFYILLGGIAWLSWFFFWNYPHKPDGVFRWCFEIVLFVVFEFCAIGLHLIWIKNFASELIPIFRKQIAKPQMASPFLKGYNLEKVLAELKMLNTDLESFKCLLSLKELHSRQKIISAYNGIDLIRFLHIILKLDMEQPIKDIKEVVEHYFANPEGSPYNLNGVNSNTSDVRGEIINAKKKFTDIKTTITAAFNNHKKKK